jgi:predicted HTH domain antitoxin
MQLAIDIPDELFLSINESKQNLTAMVKQKLALELYKSHKISISQSAKFLDMDIYSFMKLLNKYQIPAIDDYDIEAELDALRGI